MRRFSVGIKPLAVWIITAPTRFASSVRRARFLAGSKASRGIVDIGPCVRFERPVLFQGRGKVQIAEDVNFGYRLAGANGDGILLQPREPQSSISIGPRSQIMNGTEIIARTSIVIGADCRIGSRVLIVDADFHGLSPHERDTPGMSKAVTIADNVWIGTGAIVLKGVSIGRDAVIGAACVVTKDVPAGSIAAGNPMRIIGSVYNE